MILFLSFAVMIIMLLFRYQKRKFLYQQNLQDMKKRNDEEILKTKLETQEETFAALGKELHDNIGQLLNSAKLLIGITQRNLVTSPDTLTIANETLSSAIQELRSLSKSLNKEWLQQFNFIENLETEIRRFNAAGSLQISLSYTESLPMQNDEQIILFRIVQEAIQNAIKHAQANIIKIKVMNKQEQIMVYIEDDGIGFSEPKHENKGMGLLNMQHRIKLLNGSIQWKSPGKGTRVIIQLPIKNESI